MPQWLRCLIGRHEPLMERRTGQVWGYTTRCFHCGRSLGTTTLVPSWRLLRDLYEDCRRVRGLRRQATPVVSRTSDAPRLVRRS